MTVLVDRPRADAEGSETADGSTATRPGRIARLVRGRPDDPAWVRPALLVLLAGTAVAYLWALGDSGWANSFYSAAVQAGTKSWKAFFFGSSDASNFITVDKPPAALWVMELSARVLGLNSWSILVPQALEGVATVGLVYATVRRWFSPGAALIAGVVTATTPVAVLMFRYNNPDAFLVLLLTLAAYATVRALERASTAWLVLAAAAVGTGFITKMLQSFLVVPALAIVYLVAAPTPLRRRIKQLLIAGAGVFVSSAWWVAAVELTPAADRPYIGGSQNNDLLNLIFGYNGLGRISGNESGSVGGAGAVGSRWGPTGLIRLFQTDMGGQISWLIPAALILTVACVWITRRSVRTDRTRAAIMLWGGWLVVTGLVFSYARGIIHPYYNVALAPAIGALVGVGTATLWRMRRNAWVRSVLALALAATSVWAFVLLDRSPGWLPWLRIGVLGVGMGTSVLVALGGRIGRRSAIALAVVGVGTALAGPAAYALDTVATAHGGAIPSAGPALAGSQGSAGAPGPNAGAGGASGLGPSRSGSGAAGPGRPGGGIGVPGAAPGASAGGPPPAGAPTGSGGRGGRIFGAQGGSSSAQVGRRGGGAGVAAGGGFGGAPGGGFLNSTTPGKALVALLDKDAARYTWVAATVNSNSAAGYQLATGDPVMAIGGFNGTDPAPTLAAFERDVHDGKIHYFIAGGGGVGGGGTGTTAGAITQWVENHYASQTLDGVTVYDLSSS